MSFTVTVQTTHEGQELVSCFLEDMGALGVSIADAFDLQNLLQHKSELYWDYIDEELLHMDPRVHVCGFFAQKPSADDMAGLWERLRYAAEQMPVDMGSLTIVEGETTNDDDWFENWRAFYHPIHIGDITVLPAWYEKEEGLVVKINPCTAFGTGEHESTQMCLALLQGLDVKDKQVIDVGCGSGILGIASCKLGAKHCYFADIDEAAMKNCRENIALNGVDNYTAATAPLLQGCPVNGDIILANITADVLLMLADCVRDYQTKAGYLIVSGIIAGREGQVCDAFVARGYRVVDSAARQDWRAYLLQATWN